MNNRSKVAGWLIPSALLVAFLATGCASLRTADLQADALKIDVFGNVGIATFTLDYSFASGAETVHKQDRSTMVFVKEGGAWKIAHEHYWHERTIMKNDYQVVYDALHQIYQRHRRNHRENSDSKQMCCMWSTDDPPDTIEGTPPFDDIEDAFGISIDDDTALELYEMHLDEAAKKILEIRQNDANNASYRIVNPGGLPSGEGGR